MQKKIIALAIAAAVSAPAFADSSNVTVYGKFDVSYDFVNTGTSAAGVAGTTSNRVASNTSLFGLKGSEDLGDGLSGIWQVESQIQVGNSATNTATGAGSIGSRNTFIGLSSATAGTVLMGRHDTPYRMSTRRLDVFGDGIADNRNIMGGASAPVAGSTATVGASFDGRQDQVLAYVSPKLGGVFTGAIAYVNLAPTNNLATQVKTNAWSLAGMYDADGLYAALAYEAHNNLAVAGNSESAFRLGTGYTADQYSFGVAIERTTSSIAGVNLYGHTNSYLSGKYNISGNDAIKAAYTVAGVINGGVGGVANTGAKQFSLGYDHNLSKRTTAYALYTKLSNQSAAGYTLSNNSTAGGTSSSAGIGAAPSAFAFGVKHTF